MQVRELLKKYEKKLGPSKSPQKKLLKKDQKKEDQLDASSNSTIYTNITIYANNSNNNNISINSDGSVNISQNGGAQELKRKVAERAIQLRELSKKLEDSKRNEEKLLKELLQKQQEKQKA